MKGNFGLSKGSRRSISSGAGRAASRFPISHAKKMVSDYENHSFMWLLLVATYYYQKTEATQNHALTGLPTCWLCRFVSFKLIRFQQPNL
jgi:hypothetical protein